MTGPVVLRSGRHARGETAGRLASLDGIRAFAVTAVLLYHAGVSGVGGGLLGVDVFFVLSGFLITSLLCGEFRTRSTVRLGRFWAGRARRLLPALFILLLAVSAYAMWLRSSVDLASVRGDAISTLLYVANWHFVFSAQSYFTLSAAPSPLLHMWSLGVEEQYYLLWPLVALLVLRRRGSGALAWVAGAGAAASALLTASMHLAGFSPDRLYFGTDTRAQALLVGSALGAVASRSRALQGQWRVVGEARAATRAARLAGAVLGAAGAGVLVWSWHELDGRGPFLYEGGFLLVAVATAAVITAVTSWRGSLLARTCALPPVAYIGRISYGLYVYHWPLFLVLDHAHTGLAGRPLLAARLSSTFVAAVVSFHLVEEPVRTRRLMRDWRGLPVGAAAAIGTAAVVVVSTVAPATATARTAAGRTRTVSSTGMAASERQRLAAAEAFTTRPIRFVLTGDSVALTAGIGLSDLSTNRFGVQVDDRGALGCDLDPIPSRLGNGVFTSRDCASWRTLFAQVVDRGPDVAGLMLGRFELADHLYDGRWMHVGEPAWDVHLEGELDEVVSLLSSRGARVALFTFPYIDPPVERSDGTLYSENEPSRVDAFNRVLRRVALTHPRTVTVVDLARILDPGGHFTSTIDGVQVRWPQDGIHISIDGGVWLQSRVLPEIAELGLEARSTPGA